MPLPAKTPGLSPAVADLGLGDMLGQQVAGETAEERKKRLLQMQQQSSGGSLAAFSLLGGVPGAS